MPPKPPLQEQSRGLMAGYARYTALGLQFVVSMCLLGWVGNWVDGKLGTYPLLMILGFFLGAAGSFVSLLSSIPPVQSRRTSEEPDDDDEQ